MNHTNKSKNELEHGSSFEDHAGSDAPVIINCALNAPLMLLSILGNALVLAAIIRTPSIRSASMIMLGSLAVSDLLVGGIAQPLFIAKELTGKNNVFVFNLSQITVISLCGVSLSTITAITLDRYVALHYHMRYASLVTKCRVRVTVAMIWLVIFALSSLRIWKERSLQLLTAAVIIICIITCTFSYIRIYLIVRQHHLQIRTHHQAVQCSNRDNNLNIAHLSRSAINTFVFYIVLTVCYFPIYVILTFYGASFRNWKTEWNFATTTVFMNSSINPFLYCWRLGELRTAVKKIVKQMFCK